jgi:3-dehydroquinate synthase
MIMKLVIELPGSPACTSQIFIGSDTAAEFPNTLASCLEDRRAYWIWDDNVFRLWHERLQGSPWPAIENGCLLHFSASEANKRLATVEKLAAQLLGLGADRGSALVAVGGGVTGDVVGFLASIYMRGIPHIQVPTTLLAQVDSSVGGKTGVDLEEGKNLLGSFHQPQVIWIDLQFLETLPPEEFRQGMAEVIKSAMLGDENLWNYLEANTESLMRRHSEALYHVVAACCQFKARVVQLDEKETGQRRILNLGHTVGHALERLCRAWDLPVRIPADFPPEALLAAIESDKKVIRGRLHFILPVRIGEALW